MIVAFPAGGLADFIARLISTKLADRLKQSFVVENRAGGGGDIAAKAVACAAPDGHTLLTTTSGLAANHTASKNHGFEPGDLRPVAFVAYSPDVIAVHPRIPPRTSRSSSPSPRRRRSPMAALGLAPARRSARRFLQEVAEVQYQQCRSPAARRRSPRCSAATRLARADVAAGDAAHRSGQAARPRGEQHQARNAIKDVPSYTEMGYPNIEIGSWVGVFVPAKTPDAVVAKLNAEINAVMAEPDSRSGWPRQASIR